MIKVINKRFAAFANLSFGTAGLGFNIVTGLFLVPLYLHFMDAATYGSWLASGGVITMLGLCESGLSTVLTQKLAAAVSIDDQKEFACLTGTGLAFASALAGLVILLGVVLSPMLPNLIGAPLAEKHNLKIAIIMASAGSGLMSLVYSLGAIPQAWQRTVAPGVVLVFAMSANIVGILFGLWQGWGVIALGVGPFCLGAAYVIGLSIIILAHWQKAGFPNPYFSKTSLKAIWRETRNLLMAKVAASFGPNLEAPVAAIAVSPEMSAILVLTGKALSLVPGFSAKIDASIFAGLSFFSNSDSSKRKEVVAEITAISAVFAGLGLGLALAFTEPLMNLWVGKSLFAGTLLLYILVFSSVMAIRKSMYANLLISLGTIDKASYLMIGESLLRVLFLVMLVPLLKVYGIPLAGALAGGLTVLGLLYFLKKERGLPLQITCQSGFLGFTICLAIGIIWPRLLPVAHTWFELFWQALLCLLIMCSLSICCDKRLRSAVYGNLRAILKIDLISKLGA
jgi:O-antigen/teichoic acid export membrane protein